MCWNFSKESLKDETHSVCVHVCTAHPRFLLSPTDAEVFLSDTSHLCIIALMVRSSMCSGFLGSQQLFGLLLVVVGNMDFLGGMTVFSLYKWISRQMSNQNICALVYFSQLPMRKSPLWEWGHWIWVMAIHCTSHKVSECQNLSLELHLNPKWVW